MTRLAAVATCLVAVATAAPARADTKADVTAAFQALVDGIVAGKPDVTDLQLFVTPYAWEIAPKPDDLGNLKELLPKPKLSHVVVVPSKSGTSAWLVGELSAHLPHTEGDATDEQLRVSAALAKDGGTWRVIATHWSEARDNAAGPHERCLPAYVDDVAPSTPAELAAPTRAVIDALDRRTLSSLISADPHAIAIGSAPKELFTGGPAIRALFAKLIVERSPRDDDAIGNRAGVRAGVVPGGELMWIALPAWSQKYCTEYRALLVLQREGTAWKIVHQHYSEKYWGNLL